MGGPRAPRGIFGVKFPEAVLESITVQTHREDSVKEAWNSYRKVTEVRLMPSFARFERVLVEAKSEAN